MDKATPNLVLKPLALYRAPDLTMDEEHRKQVAMQSAPPHLAKINEWLDKSMENMKRMASDETYRKKIAKDLS